MAIAAGRAKQKLADKDDYDRLIREYDDKAGGYNVTTGTASNRSQQFIESQFTPDQGGYYADTNLTDFADAARAGRVTKYLSGLDEVKSLPEHMEGVLDTVALNQQNRRSALKPYQRVNPSVTRSRQTQKKQRTLAGGRRGTILTGSFGLTDDKRKRQTLLG